MHCSGTLVSVDLSVEKILVSMQCSLLPPLDSLAFLGQQQGEDVPMPSAQLTSRDLGAAEPRPCFSFPSQVCAHVSLPPFPLPFPRALAPVQPDSIHLTCFSCTSFLPG